MSAEVETRTAAAPPATPVGAQSAAPPHTSRRIVYPDSDGQPMADNTEQFRWIVTIEGGLDALFRDDPNVFVAGDLLWYPVEGQPQVRAAPDALVAFGRPKGRRGSYRQWEEGGVAPQVVFEVLSPGNTVAEMVRKFQFYDRYGVEEYYVYDPDHGRLHGWLRRDGVLTEIGEMQGWVSPRLGVRFELDGDDLALYRPDGERFASYVELMEQRDRERARAEQARLQAEQARLQAERAERRVEAASRHAEEERLRAERERQRAETLAARLRALGVDPSEV
jgi:Uma2 family endonuclease